MLSDLLGVERRDLVEARGVVLKVERPAGAQLAGCLGGLVLSLFLGPTPTKEAKTRVEIEVTRPDGTKYAVRGGIGSGLLVATGQDLLLSYDAARPAWIVVRGHQGKRFPLDDGEIFEKTQSL